MTCDKGNYASERHPGLDRQGRHAALGSLAAMARSGSVPLLLLLLPLLLLPLTSAVANVYQQLANVTNVLLKADDQSGPRASASECANSCDALQYCSGYIFDGGMCDLYIVDCRVPEHNGTPAPTNYMAKLTCPGEMMQRLYMAKLTCPGMMMQRLYMAKLACPWVRMPR